MIVVADARVDDRRFAILRHAADIRHAVHNGVMAAPQARRAPDGPHFHASGQMNRPLDRFHSIADFATAHGVYCRGWSQIGRATLFALAVAGESGVDRTLALLHAEFDNAVGLCGITRVDEWTPAAVRRRR